MRNSKIVEIPEVSGRDKGFLESHFGAYESVTLIAEHGYFKRGPDTAHEWLPFTPYQTLDWKDRRSRGPVSILSRVLYCTHVLI